MIKFLTNLFRKKETLLVAVVKMHYESKTVFDPYWISGMTTYRCYERNDGYRWVDASIESSKFKIFSTVGLLNDWAKHRAHVLKIPSYADIKSGEKEVYTTDAYH